MTGFGVLEIQNLPYRVVSSFTNILILLTLKSKQPISNRYIPPKYSSQFNFSPQDM